MTMYLMLFRQGQSAVSAILSAIGGMYEDNLYLRRSTNTSRRRSTSSQGSVVRGPQPEDGMRFEHVSFAYPGAEQPSLVDVDLHIKPGESLALVGENGSGKTTLIKLLTRLYQPTAGRILLDGQDLREWDEAALRQRIGVIFQDFARYQLLLGENIGAGDVQHFEDEARWREAGEKGMAQPIVDTLPEGYRTPLGKWFNDGRELSGGQWQKIALSRAFMRSRADILVLDEPTAAMDAAAEATVFEHFRTLTRGKIAILISHRFSTVRMADQIVVLQDGRIIERGSHEELMRAERPLRAPVLAAGEGLPVTALDAPGRRRNPGLTSVDCHYAQPYGCGYPQRHFPGAVRSDAPGHSRTAAPGRGDGQRAGRAVRRLAAGDLEASRLSRAREPDREAQGRPRAVLLAARRAAQAGVRLDGRLSAVLGRRVRSPGWPAATPAAAATTAEEEKCPQESLTDRPPPARSRSSACSTRRASWCSRRGRSPSCCCSGTRRTAARSISRGSTCGPAGRFHSCIHNPRFGDCWCVGVYREIVRPERIVYTLATADSEGNEIEPAQAGHDPRWPRETLVTVTFAQVRGGTKLTLEQSVAESLAKHTGAHPSWLEMLDRLAALVATRNAGDA